MIIKSSTSLRNDYANFSLLAHDVQEPIFITKNGEGDLVVMSIETFETLRLQGKWTSEEAQPTAEEQLFTQAQSWLKLDDIYGNKA